MRRRTLLGAGMAVAAASFLPTRPAAPQDAAARLLERLQAVRCDMQLPELSPHPALFAMARMQAQHIHRLGRPSHTDRDGSNPPGRALKAGYQGRVLGEVLAEAREGPDEVLDLWLAHEETQAVLLDPLAHQVGVFGIRDAGTDRWDLVTGSQT
ncbi:CAP domain-containing protein [Roseibacterium sp. SDUM158017]|uniref:CAP domain-containing protein n=1 Tax=Roseicyclus salinarum TaxID=3036773 RepID=UPI002414E97C|nr:CAP domain-containing protein [Roseibacterium sp. SDUM158017]MDG4649623.1 CAP domain-containing protein [Roseibacterium sp. SDUM158017]